MIQTLQYGTGAELAIVNRCLLKCLDIIRVICSLKVALDARTHQEVAGCH